MSCFNNLDWQNELKGKFNNQSVTERIFCIVVRRDGYYDKESCIPHHGLSSDASIGWGI